MASAAQTNVAVVEKARPAGSLARATPLTGRLMLCLGLLFLVPALSFQVHVWIHAWLALEDIQALNLVFAAMAAGAGFWLWRRFVRWTLGRAAATAITMLLPLAQVLWWQPMFNVGCVSDDLLRTGQNLTLTGLWVWMAVWLWWGLDRGWAVLRTRWPLHGYGSRIMTPTARCVTMGFGLLPFLAGVWLILAVFLVDVIGIPNEEEHAIMICNGVCAAVALTVWILTWRRRVDWTHRARLWTILSAGTLLHVAVLMPLYHAEYCDISGVCLVAVPVMALGLWLMLTAFLWPARAVPAQERIEASLRCSRCGYSLRGLTATRCPECGFEPTLEAFCAGWVTEEGL